MISQFEEAMRHETYIQRLASGIANERIDPAYIDISALVLRMLDGYSSDMPMRELYALQKEITAAIEKKLTPMWNKVTADLGETATYEAGYQSNTIAAIANVQAAAISAASIEAKINKPLILGQGAGKTIGFWPEYVAGNKSGLYDLVDKQIRIGRAENQTREQIVKTLVGTKKAGYSDGLINDKSRRWAQTLVRTGMSHYANAAREACADTFDDVLDGKIFSNVFDNRTTPICLHHGQQAHAGKVYARNDPKAPRIPLHMRCRSLWIMKIKGVDPFGGTRASVGGNKGAYASEEYAARNSKLAQQRSDRAAKRAEGEDTPETASKVRYKGKKDAGIFDPGQIDADISPQQFFERQPDWWIKSSLGAKRAKLFREGGLPIDKFVDKDGNFLTLKEMAALDEYSPYFKKAGVRP
jgi:hypothetical protein